MHWNRLRHSFIVPDDPVDLHHQTVACRFLRHAALSIYCPNKSPDAIHCLQTISRSPRLVKADCHTDAARRVRFSRPVASLRQLHLHSATRSHHRALHASDLDHDPRDDRLS